MHPSRKTCALVLACACAVALTGTGAPVEIVPPALRGALQPQVAVSPRGAIHIAFGKDDAIYHVASLDGGHTYSPPTRVAEVAKLGLGMRRGPRLAVTQRGLVISAISLSTGTLHAWTSADGGATWTHAAPINDAPNSAREGLHAMASDGSDHVFAAWLDLRSGATELWSAASSDGGAHWSPNQLLYQSPDGHICECCHPSVAMEATGGLAVMWRNWLGGARDMYLITSKDGGKTFSPAQKLGSGTWKLAACPMDGGAVALQTGVQPITAWRRGKTVLTTAQGASDLKLAEPAAQPIILKRRSAVDMLFESGGDLYSARLGSPSGNKDAQKLFAKSAKFASGASGLPGDKAIIVWESTAASTPTLLAEVIE